METDFSSRETISARWLSVDEIAQHLGVSKVSIYKWCEAGKMPAHKVGRQLKFKATEVDEWVLGGLANTAEPAKSGKVG